MSERKAGYYWVKDGLGWEPLRWSGCVWDGHFNDADFEEIGHRIPTPDEPWVYVPKRMDRAMMSAAIPNDQCNFPDYRAQEYDMQARYIRALSAAPKPEDV